MLSNSTDALENKLKHFDQTQYQKTLLFEERLSDIVGRVKAVEEELEDEDPAASQEKSTYRASQSMKKSAMQDTSQAFNI